jgi:hypothetical protein
VDLAARVLEQHGKVGEALAVPQPRLPPAIPKRPMVTLAPEPLSCRLGHDVLLPAGSIRPGQTPLAISPPRLDRPVIGWTHRLGFLLLL